MMSTAKRYPATEEKTTLRDKPTFASCLKSEMTLLKVVFVSIAVVKFIRK